MEGKVFAESSNIYQDQAKVLFDYFKKAAEKIVSEEENFEGKIAVCEEEIIQNEAELKKAKLIRNVCFGLFFLVIPIIVAIVQILKIKELEEVVQQTKEKKKGFESAHKEIFRDYKVTKLGLGYVPVAAKIPFENKSFVIDLTDKVDQQHFQLNTLKQTELFTKAVSDLDRLMESAPVVDGSEETEIVDTDDYSLSIQNVPYHDYYGQVDRALRTSSFCLEDLESKSVTLPIVMPDSDYAEKLTSHAALNTGTAPIFRVYDESRFQDDIERFHSLNQMKKSLESEHVEFEQGLRTKMMDVARSVQAVTQSKLESSHHLVDASNKTLLKILKCSYNHYSPNLESEEIDRIRDEKFNYQDSLENYKPFSLKQSSKVRYDITSDNWVAEDGSKVSHPFGVHQIHEEIVAPIVQNLMSENRKERLQIYNNIKDQKIDYLNQWHRDTEDFYARNRAESNALIDKMRSTLSEYISSYNAMVALKKTGENLQMSPSLEEGVVEDNDNEAEVFAAFEAKSTEFKTVQSDFSNYMDRLKEDIDRRAERFEHIEYYDASLRDATFRSYALASSKVGALDERRSALASVNPYFAESSELPPVPAIEELTNEHLSINLPRLAEVALNELDGVRSEEEEGQAQVEAVDSEGADFTEATHDDGETFNDEGVENSADVNESMSSETNSVDKGQDTIDLGEQSEQDNEEVHDEKLESLKDKSAPEMSESESTDVAEVPPVLDSDSEQSEEDDERDSDSEENGGTEDKNA